VTMKTVTENGKTYTIDDHGMVVQASVVEPEIKFEESADAPLSLNERVEAEGRLGHIVSRMSTVYGTTVGVKFDDGSFESLLEEHVKRSEVEQVRYDKPIDEVKADWETYQKMPDYTPDELDEKSVIARRLNVTAKALITDPRTPLSDQVTLDHIVLATGTDLYDMRERVAAYDEQSESEYLASQPKFHLPEAITPSTSRSREDVSWLLVAAEDVQDETDSFDWDSHLTNEALSATARLTEEQLSSDDFMTSVASYRDDSMPRGYDDEKKAKFRTLLESARTAALTERTSQRTAKTAKVEEDLADFDTSALFL
jgi:hypothetical protein